MAGADPLGIVPSDVLLERLFPMSDAATLVSFYRTSRLFRGLLELPACKKIWEAVFARAGALLCSNNIISDCLTFHQQQSFFVSSTRSCKSYRLYGIGTKGNRVRALRIKASSDDIISYDNDTKYLLRTQRRGSRLTVAALVTACNTTSKTWCCEWRTVSKSAFNHDLLRVRRVFVRQNRINLLCFNTLTRTIQHIVLTPGVGLSPIHCLPIDAAAFAREQLCC